MTVLYQFNNILKELNSISKELENTIANNCVNWTEEKKRQAITIVRQLSEKNLLVYGRNSNYEYVNFRNLKLELKPHECLDKKRLYFSSAEDVFRADAYIANLLNDINQLTPIINFYLVGHTPKNLWITFDIGWEF